jgi:hypothetical protein
LLLILKEIEKGCFLSGETHKKNNYLYIHKNKIIDDLAKAALEANEKYQNLFNKHLEMKKKMEFMYQEALALPQEKEKKEALRLKKQLAKKLTLKDTISTDEFHFRIQNIQGKG